MAKKICPRCGAPYNWLEVHKRESNIYVYAVHVVQRKPKRKVVKHYLGPLERYIYVNRLHPRENLGLTGMLNEDRAIQYLEALIEYFNRILSEGKGVADREKIRRVRRLVEELLMEVELLDA